ncbi:MAG: hypothetical protein WDW36_004903 [Sanguina aurantia]
MRAYKKQETLRRTLLVEPHGYSTSGVPSAERSPGVHAPAGCDDGFKQSSARSSSTNLHPSSSHAAASDSVGSTSALEVPRLSTSPTADTSFDDNRPSVHLGAGHEKATLDLSHMLSGQCDLSALLPTSTFQRTPPGVTAQRLTDVGSAQWADDSEISPHVPQAGTDSHPAGLASHPSLSQLLLGDGQTREGHSHGVAHSLQLSEEERVHQACKRISQALSTRPVELPQPSVSSAAVEAAAFIPEEGEPGGPHTSVSDTGEDVLLGADQEASGHPRHGAGEEMDDKLLATYRFQELTPDGGVAITFDLMGLSFEDGAPVDMDALTALHEALASVIKEETKPDRRLSSMGTMERQHPLPAPTLLQSRWQQHPAPLQQQRQARTPSGDSSLAAEDPQSPLRNLDLDRLMPMTSFEYGMDDPQESPGPAPKRLAVPGAGHALNSSGVFQASYGTDALEGPEICDQASDFSDFGSEEGSEREDPAEPPLPLREAGSSSEQQHGAEPACTEDSASAAAAAAAAAGSAAGTGFAALAELSLSQHIAAGVTAAAVGAHPGSATYTDFAVSAPLGHTHDDLGAAAATATPVPGSFRSRSVSTNGGGPPHAPDAAATAPHPHALTAHGSAAAAAASDAAAKAAGATSKRHSGHPVGSRSRKGMAAAAAAAAKEDLNKSIRVGFLQGKLKPINIVIMVVGTRGDVQPFVGIGLKLLEYGHRVRIASHLVYREFVEGFGLEFYPIGGDPKVLSEFVVKHRGIMPGFHINDALQQREQVREIMFSTYGSCVMPDPAHPDRAFRADAIIANPPSYGHIHCAEVLNIPLHIVFTMPWTPTQGADPSSGRWLLTQEGHAGAREPAALLLIGVCGESLRRPSPQPFARIKTVMGEAASKARAVMNWLSYFAVEDLAWLGMAGMVKNLRQNVFGLKSWDKYSTSHALYHSKVPITYIWSPHLVPRPSDWGPHCEVVGFVNVELQKLMAYTPPRELSDFLAAGPPPVYIGFGSLVVDDPVKLTQNFMDAVERTGLRAIIQSGWGGLGAGVTNVPPDILFIDSAPHDWLFSRVQSVVHHGGAGTTATGLYAGKPTFIVPFFGDQPFWGAACARAGVGPDPVAIDDLNTERIVEAFKELILPSRQKAALALSAKMHKEDGISGAVDHLHRTLYGALQGGQAMHWMRREGGDAPGGAAGADGGDPTPGPSSAIRATETTEGGVLSGFLHIPRTLAGLFVGRSTASLDTLTKTSRPTTSLVPTSQHAVLLPMGLPTMPEDAVLLPTTPETPHTKERQLVPITAVEPRKKGIFSFLGC